MFDQLVESEPAGAEFKGRRGYFMVSFVVVGVLFLTAVVISIYADDIGLGNDQLELVEMLAPVDPPTAPRTPEPATRMADTRSSSALPTRVENMASTQEPIAPTSISTAPAEHLSRPAGQYTANAPFDSDPGSPGTGHGAGPIGTGSSTDGLTAEGKPAADEADVPPPALKKLPAPSHNVIRSIGVANGKAVSLPKPTYSAAAIAMHADGAVNVQVLIDETGRVLSATAVSGNPLLKPAAEAAARQARFTPTLLSNVPVKVTGVIVYNFVR